ncbi:MAG TPA: hypothetical protein DD435_15735 [Cyanobacteria bacterium UBA8530]|nr:hypothetical protein [Cyanobacteria bacterium UBA8530]
MEKKLSTLALLAILLSGCGGPSPLNSLPVAGDKKTLEYVADEIIVKYKNEGFGLQAEKGAIQRFSLPNSTRIDTMSLDSQDDTNLIRVPQGMKSEQAIALYSQNKEVEFAQQNYRINVRGDFGVKSANDPLSAKQWYLPYIHVNEAWRSSTGSKVVVAVLDTGVDFAHPDLAGQVIQGPDYAENKDARDVFGHGTHVAGIIAAKSNNGVGVSGVAPDARILAIKVLGKDGGGSIFSIAKGIKYAADYGAKNNCHVVINLSLGGGASFDPINTVAGWYAARRGALLVAAAGNSNNAVGTPARIKYFMAVSATDHRDQKAGFSCYGSELSVAAPGVDIMSTTPTYKVPLNDYGYAQNYASLQGTSMATPMVSGIAALVWARHPDWKAEQVRSQLEKSSRDIGNSGRDQYFGFGRVDALSAVQ